MSSFKFSVKSWHNLMGQNENNNALAAEYKHATDKRRTEIFTEYYKNNEKFCTTWVRWEREHWAELTQNFVTHWHRAFSQYSPNKPTAVFNFYMDQNIKRHASEDYKRYLHKVSRWTGYETSGSLEYKEPKIRKELYVHPTSASDVSILREQLCRNLDEQELKIMDHHYFGDMTKAELTDAFFPAVDAGRKKKVGQKRGLYAYRYVHENLLNKLAIRFRRMDIA